MTAPSNEANLGGGVKIVAAVALASIVAIDEAPEQGGAEDPSQGLVAKPTTDSGDATQSPQAAPVGGPALDASGRPFARPVAPPPTPEENEAAREAHEAALAARAIDENNPPQFDNPAQAREWWTAKALEAKAVNERLSAAVADLPRREALIENAANPEKSRALFEKSKARTEAALKKSNERVAKIDAELDRL